MVFPCMVQGVRSYEGKNGTRYSVHVVDVSDGARFASVIEIVVDPLTAGQLKVGDKVSVSLSGLRVFDGGRYAWDGKLLPVK